MGIFEKVSTLLPHRTERRPDRRPVRAEALALRSDLDRWLERVFDEPLDLAGLVESAAAPTAEVHETNDDVIVEVELPGLDREDVELTATPAGLLIRGERQGEKEAKRKDVDVTERFYGSFVRTVPLPPGLDLDRAEARMKRGVLTV